VARLDVVGESPYRTNARPSVPPPRLLQRLRSWAWREMRTEAVVYLGIEVLAFVVQVLL
jgi:hypothetical protein